MSVLGRCLPYKERKEIIEERQVAALGVFFERQGPNLGVRFRKVFALRSQQK